MNNMDHEAPIDAAHQHDSMLSQDTSSLLLQTQCDDWSMYKDEIFKVYIQQKKTLKDTMQIIEDQGGPKASKRTWKSKLKQLGLEKNLSSTDMNAMETISRKRRQGEGKETIFYHFGSEIASGRMKRLRKTAEILEIASPSAETPPNITYSTPGPEDAASNEMQSRDFVIFPSTQDLSQGINADTLPISLCGNLEAIDDPVSQSNHMDEEIMELLAQNSQFLHVSDNHHFLIETTPEMTHIPPTSPDQFFLQNLELLRMPHNFNKALSNLSFDSEIWDVGADNTRWLDSPSLGDPSFDREPALCSTDGNFFSSALINLPWFRFQLLIRTNTGSMNTNLRRDSLLSQSSLSFDLPSSSNLAEHSNSTELRTRCKVVSKLFLLPDSINQDIISQFSSKLQELIPETSVGEVQTKLQLVFHPANNLPFNDIAEIVSFFLSNDTFGDDRVDEFLQLAVKDGAKQLFKSIFEMKTPTVDAFSEKITEAICRTGDSSTLQLLIDCGLEKRLLTGSSGGRYLQLSLYHSKIDIANILLDHAADVNPPLGDSYPYDSPPLHLALMCAVTCCESGLICRLLKANADVNIKCGDNTPLTLAAQMFDVTQELLQAGANVDDGMIDDRDYIDWVYFHSKQIYRIVSPMSRRAATTVTTAGILDAASKSMQCLLRYLDSYRNETVMSRREKLESALWHAFSQEQTLEAISVLLDCGVDPEVETVNTSDSLVCLAARRGKIELIQRLLNSNPALDLSTALQAVAYFEDSFDTTVFLLEQVVDLVVVGSKVLRRAISGNNLPGIKLLISWGVDITDTSLCRDGYTYLAAAAAYTNLKTVKFLFENGAVAETTSQSAAGITPLQAAATAGRLEVVQYLLSIGSNVNAKPSSKRGTTALEASLQCYAIEERHANIFKLLMDKGADINGPRNRQSKNWNSALVTLIIKSAGSHLISRALDAGADVNMCGRGAGARTPLQAAAEVSNFDLVKELLKRGARLDAPPSANYGRTVLQAACSGKNPSLKLVQYLLEKGAKVNAAAGIKAGLTALQGAAIQGHIKIALALLDAGADVNADPADIEGRMALDGAAEHGRLDMVHMLLNVSAKSEVPGETGFDNAIKLARKNGHFAVARLLESWSTS